MKVELFPPESVSEPRHWVRHDQAFAMMMGPGSIEWGSQRSTMEKFDYAAGDLALCYRQPLPLQPRTVFWPPIAPMFGGWHGRTPSVLRRLTT